MSSQKSKKLNLEQSMTELEEIVSKLEQKEVSLEESINFFEKGVKLYKQCQEAIGLAEKKISVLSEDLKEEELNS